MSAVPSEPLGAHAATADQLRAHREQVVELLRRYGLGNPRLWRDAAGSAGLLVDLGPTADSFDLFEVEDGLRRLLHAVVPVVSDGALRNPWSHDDLERAELL